jgi:hypothetical protein
MKRLAILIFCTSAYGLDTPIEETCDDTHCRISRARVQEMYNQRQQAIEERNNAMDAYRVMRSLATANCAIAASYKEH